MAVSEMVEKHTSCLTSGETYVKILEPDVVEHLVMLTEVLEEAANCFKQSASVITPL